MEFIAGLSPEPILAAAGALALILLIAAICKCSAAGKAVERAEMVAAKERERAEALEGELRAKAAAPTVGLSDTLRAFEEMPDALRLAITGTSPGELGEGVGRALERLLGVEQWMVFLDADRTGTDFVLAASGAVDNISWPVGARVTPQMGRVGLVIRRGKALDRDDFEAEPPLVREQLVATEPKAFRVDIAAPIVIGDSVVGVVTVGGPRMSLHLACAIVQVLCEGAAAGFRLQDAQKRSARLENVDELTGLHNRNWFTAHASEVLFRNTDYDVPISAAVFGIDGFVDYSTREGPSQAQRLLRAVACLAKPMFRKSDLFCRWTDDEFAVLMPGIDRASARATLDRVRRAIAKKDWVGVDKQPAGVLTVSVGLAVAPQDGIRFDPLIEAAHRGYQQSLERGGDQTTGEATRRLREPNLSLADTVDLPQLPSAGDLTALAEYVDEDLRR